MEQTYIYKTEHVCSRQIEITHEDGIVKKVVFVGGCPGNTQGVARLAVGHTVEELIQILKGVPCPRSGEFKTSCPDQLARALEQLR